jgi:hypothetical protein
MFCHVAAAADFAAFREEMYSNTIHMPIQAVQKLHDELWGATSGNAGPLVQLARKLLKIGEELLLFCTHVTTRVQPALTMVVLSTVA